MRLRPRALGSRLGSKASHFTFRLNRIDWIRTAVRKDLEKTWIFKKQRNAIRPFIKSFIFFARAHLRVLFPTYKSNVISHWKTLYCKSWRKNVAGKTRWKRRKGERQRRGDVPRDAPATGLMTGFCENYHSVSNYGSILAQIQRGGSARYDRAKLPIANRARPCEMRVARLRRVPKRNRSPVARVPQVFPLR